MCPFNKKSRIVDDRMSRVAEAVFKICKRKTCGNRINMRRIRRKIKELKKYIEFPDNKK